MRVLLVDPYYLAGHSPPSWVLGRLEITLEAQGHAVLLSDFCPERSFATLAEFHEHERRFIDATALLAGRSDAVVITTSFGVPQKPTPIFGRVEALVRAIATHAPGVPIVVGGAQVEYLLSAGVDPARVIESGAVTAFVASDEAMLGALSPAIRVSAPLEAPCEWRAWDASRYPPYRAVLTSLGCRYGCSFCFEATQQFRPFDFRATMGAFAERTGLLALEDSTVFGAHGVTRVVAALDACRTPVIFTCYALVNEMEHVSMDDLRRLRQRGMLSVILGIETPDTRTLRLYKKHVRPDRVRRVLDKLHEAGMSAQGCLMVGIPEVSLSDTLYTLEYALALSIDVRRWHVFQPSFVRPTERLVTPEPLSVVRFARTNLNVPDNLLPELFTSVCQEAFVEEHFLVRAIPYAAEAPDILARFEYRSGYTLKDLYARMLELLRGTKGSFNEEDYYRVLTPHDARFAAVMDRGASAVVA